MGGATWVVLQYLLGLRRLGQDVCFVEPVSALALRPEGTTLADSDNAAYFEEVVSEFGLRACSALLLEGSGETVGMPYARLRDLTRRADLLINMSGALTDNELVGPIRARAYVDLEPAFSQLRHVTEGGDLGMDSHTHWVTVGMAVGKPGCHVPPCDLPWITTLQPVVLDRWPVNRQLTRHALTTVATWDGGRAVEHEGMLYGQKAHSLRNCITLPSRTEEQFLLALSLAGNCSTEMADLTRNGWQVIDAERITGTPDAYRRFIQRSWAELGVARSGYVTSRSGWFSDRSACYLASGRPVIAQDTGWAAHLATGPGLLAFRESEEAVAAIHRLHNDRPRRAGAAARSVAVDHLNSKTVLCSAIDQLATGATCRATTGDDLA